MDAHVCIDCYTLLIIIEHRVSILAKESDMLPLINREQPGSIGHMYMKVAPLGSGNDIR